MSDVKKKPFDVLVTLGDEIVLHDVVMAKDANDAKIRAARNWTDLTVKQIDPGDEDDLEFYARPF